MLIHLRQSNHNLTKKTNRGGLGDTLKTTQRPPKWKKSTKCTGMFCRNTVIAELLVKKGPASMEDAKIFITLVVLMLNWGGGHRIKDLLTKIKVIG